MPQLDSVTFFSQVFWVLFVFLFFYSIAIKQLLPLVVRVLKVRFKKTELNRSSTNIYNVEVLDIQRNFDKIVLSSWNIFSSLSFSSNTGSKKWVYENALGFDLKAKTKAANVLFIKYIGDSKMRQSSIESKIF